MGLCIFFWGEMWSLSRVGCSGSVTVVLILVLLSVGLSVLSVSFDRIGPRKIWNLSTKCQQVAAVRFRGNQIASNHLILQLFDNVARRRGDFVSIRVIQRIEAEDTGWR